MNDLFCQIVDKLEQNTQPKLRDPAKVKTAFKRMVSRSNISQSELDALVGAFARMRKRALPQ
jgi:tRNA C32,U32 (ribose-2'-O)-methylase TrmJ